MSEPLATDVQAVLDSIAETAARLFEANDALIFLVDGDELWRAAGYGAVETRGVRLPKDESTVPGRVILERAPIHIADVLTRLPDLKARPSSAADRTVLAVPMLREVEAVGVLMIRHHEVRPFTDAQIRAAQTFAAFAASTIERARLSEALQVKTEEQERTLEEQAATSLILEMVSRSPIDVQPVLDAIVDRASSLCSSDNVAIRLVEGDVLRVAARVGSISPGAEIRLDQVSASANAVRERGTVYVPYPDPGRFGGDLIGSIVAVPLVGQGAALGTLILLHPEPNAYTERQIKLLETFAAQAVIAIENARLFNDLKEALAHQTATSDVLQIISSSPTDVQPVFEAIADRVAQVCAADEVLIRRLDGGWLRAAAYRAPLIEGPLERAGDIPFSQDRVSGRAIIGGKTIHVEDMEAAHGEYPDIVIPDTRTFLAVPLMREGTGFGCITVRRAHVEPFTAGQIALLETFADQAVIAIENARLFRELNERNAALHEALEQQTATAEVLRIISSSPTELQPVLDAICESAARVCGAADTAIGLVDGDFFVTGSIFGGFPRALLSDKVPIRPGGAIWRLSARVESSITATCRSKVARADAA